MELTSTPSKHPLTDMASNPFKTKYGVHDPSTEESAKRYLDPFATAPYEQLGTSIPEDSRSRPYIDLDPSDCELVSQRKLISHQYVYFSLHV